MPRLAGLILVVAACHRGSTAIAAQSSAVSLRADSASYSVRVNGPLYEATIGFSFANRSGRTLSANRCGAPPPPTLEKQRADGAWVFAYGSIQLTCLSLPPFRVPDGITYRGALKLAAGRPGTNIVPKLEADSVPGTYRLRWDLRAGADPDDRAAPIVTTTSPPFRLTLP